MATSREPVLLPPNTWVDLYAATGIAVGTSLLAHNPHKTPVYVTEASSEPEPLQASPSQRTVGIVLMLGADDRILDEGAVGAWAIAFSETTLQVEVN